MCRNFNSNVEGGKRDRSSGRRQNGCPGPAKYKCQRVKCHLSELLGGTEFEATGKGLPNVMVTFEHPGTNWIQRHLIFKGSVETQDLKFN
jgi:hypothetical protein